MMESVTAFTDRYAALPVLAQALLPVAASYATLYLVIYGFWVRHDRAERRRRDEAAPPGDLARRVLLAIEDPANVPINLGSLSRDFGPVRVYHDDGVTHVSTTVPNPDDERGRREVDEDLTGRLSPRDLQAIRRAADARVDAARFARIDSALPTLPVPAAPDEAKAPAADVAGILPELQEVMRAYRKRLDAPELRAPAAAHDAPAGVVRYVTKEELDQAVAALGHELRSWWLTRQPAPAAAPPAATDWGAVQAIVAKNGWKPESKFPWGDQTGAAWFSPSQATSFYDCGDGPRRQPHGPAVLPDLLYDRVRDFSKSPANGGRGNGVFSGVDQAEAALRRAVAGLVAEGMCFDDAGVWKA